MSFPARINTSSAVDTNPALIQSVLQLRLNVGLRPIIIEHLGDIEGREGIRGGGSPQMKIVEFDSG